MDASTSTCHFAPVFPYRPELKRKQPQIPQGPRNFPALEKTWLVEFETFNSLDHKTQIFSHLFRPAVSDPENAHRALIVLHGQSEHSGRYIHWPHYLKDHIGSIYAIDHRGHGRSSGFRGHVTNFDSYAEDARLAIERYANYLKNRYGKAEIHLLGHSMGGLVAMRCLLQSDLLIKSVICSAPLVKLAFQISPIKKLIAHLLNHIMPFLPVPGEPMADLVSRDPAVVDHYKNDPLVHGIASPGFYFSYLAAKEDTLKRVKEFKVPMLFLLPMADRIVSSEATEALFQQIETPEKKLIRYPGLYHEIFNEPEKDRVFADLISWLDRHKD